MKKDKNKKEEREKIKEGMKEFLNKGKKIQYHKPLSYGKYYVYLLVDPQTNKAFYVGKGTGSRMYHHERLVENNEVPNNNYNLFDYIKHLKKNNIKIIYRKVFSTNNEALAYKIEKNFIDKIGLDNLTNLVPGSLGSHKGMSWLKKSKAKKKLKKSK